ncbi:metallophosphoesterase family protein [Halorubellus sp. PRR65]|uniref:metallophosphoesterase family protein n=1 Tax=Halorubellus sp. PRR65 TaxID=3098148 RepID=UPI002B2567D3|nr:metallophosphoesterase family protein [Halorubellus sp. PRR65]
MRVAVISDVHGNRVALDAVLADMPRVAGVLCAGDVVGYGPWPGECIDLIRREGATTVMGNHDRAVVQDSGFRFNDMAQAGVEYARDVLDDEHVEYLADLPDERLAAGGRVKVVHGHPNDPDHYTRPNEFSPRLLDDEDVLVMGHTHVQAHEKYGDGIVMNPGSVGQPRDDDPDAAYALLDLDRMTVEERRVEYDVDAVQDAVEEAGLPKRIGTRLARGE